MRNVGDLISVVIPTTGLRPESLLRAIRSVSRQDYAGPIEIIVADDSVAGLDLDELQAAAKTTRLEIIETTKTRGLTRQFGVEASNGDWIAFLDDDDEWDIAKLRKQHAVACEIAGAGRVPVVSCRLRHTFAGTDQAVGGVPNRLIADEDVAQYLFRRRPAKVGRPSIFTSTIFASAVLCKSVQWRVVPRHQDWDWLVRAQEYPNVKFAHCPEELVSIAVGSSGSISALNDWRSSLSWARSALKSRGDSAVYADFLVAQPFRYALQARDIHGIRELLLELLLNRRTPSLHAIATGLAGLMPRRRMERVMSMFTTQSTRRKSSSTQ